MKLIHSPRFALLGCAAALFAAVDTQAALSARTADRDTDDVGTHAKKAGASTISAAHSPHAGGTQQLNIGAQGGVQTSAKKFGTTLDGEGGNGTIDAAALATDDSAATGARLLQ